MHPSFSNETFQNLTNATPKSLQPFQEEQFLAKIKKRLIKEINTFRNNSSLHEFLEDHSITKVLENTAPGHYNMITPEYIIPLLEYKTSPADLQILSSNKQLSSLVLNKDDVLQSLENCFLEILRQMMQITYKEKFVDKRISNMALNLSYDSAQAYLVLVFSRTILSVESIINDRDECIITGHINDPNYSLFILLVKFKDYDVVISPNKMNYDFINHIYKIKVENKHMTLSPNKIPNLQFYMKAGSNSVKYGQGSDFSYQDIVKMYSILTLGYSMPFIYVESPYVQQKNFLVKTLVNNTSPKSITPDLSPNTKATDSSKAARNFMNSPMPKIPNSSRLSRGALASINEEAEIHMSPNFAKHKRVNWNKTSHNKENHPDNKTNEPSTSKKNLFSAFKSPQVNSPVVHENISGRTSNLPVQALQSNSDKAVNSIGQSPRDIDRPGYLLADNTQKLNNKIDPSNSFIAKNLSTNYSNCSIYPDLTTQLSRYPNIFDPRSAIMNNQSTTTSPGYNNLPSSNLFSHEQYNLYPPLEHPSNLPNYSNNEGGWNNTSAKVPQTINKEGVKMFNLDPRSNNLSSQFPNTLSYQNNPSLFSLLTTKSQEIDANLLRGSLNFMGIEDNCKTYKLLLNGINFKIFDPKEVTIDPNLFKGEPLSDLAQKHLAILEKKLVENCCMTKVQQYVQLYKSNEMQDVILKFKDSEDVKAHKVVLLQSPYFEKIFQTTKTLPNEPITILMPEFLRVNSFRQVLKYMYHAELEPEEIAKMTLVIAREILLTAYTLQLHHLMNIILVRVLIPKMDKAMCVEFLKDSFEREDDKAQITWKTLHHYCLTFFALHSKSILNKYRRSFEGIETKLVYKMVNKALIKCRDIQHMYDLLSLLVEHGFASNLLNILEKIPIIKEADKKFDVKYIPNSDEIISSLNPKCCYETDLISCATICKNESHLVEEIFEGKNIPKPNLPKRELFNHLELSLREKKGSALEPGLESNEWPEIKLLDPAYEMKLQFESELVNKTIISQSFDSETRSWRLIIDIEEDQKVSAFLLEKGPPSHTAFTGPFKNEFTAVKYLIQIKDGEREYETIVFHTYANDHHYCVGHRRFFSIPYLSKKNILHVKVWVMEFPVYSCAIQYLSTRFNDLLKETFQDNDISKIINMRGEERNHLGTKRNNLNQPVSKKGYKSDEMKQQEEFRKRRSIGFLEGNFFKEVQHLSMELAAQAVCRAVLDGKPDSMGGNSMNQTVSSGSNILPKNINNISSILNEKGSKGKKFEELSPYDFYYLVSSDYLTIEHEKFLTYFMYKFTGQKDEEMINLISFGIRFSYVELSKLFNIARDLVTIRSNKMFISKLDFEINSRMTRNKPFDRPRRFYSSEMYKEWNFKNDLLRWLIESDHHQGYRLKVDELRKIIRDKENKLKNQEEMISQMNSKIVKMDHAMAKQGEGMGIKKVKLNSEEQGQGQGQAQAQAQATALVNAGGNQHGNTGIINTLKDTCNVF